MAADSHSRRRKPDYRFPWRAGNLFELLVDGDRFFPAMLEAVAAARHRILLEIYLFESGSVAKRFIDQLTDARRRGVRVCLLLDDFGAHGLHAHDRARLLTVGVELVFYNPLRWLQPRRNLFRDHRKLLVVDDTLAFVGGAGITDEFGGPRRRARHWHETMVRIQGPCITDWVALFARNWEHWGGVPLSAPPAVPPMALGRPGRVVVSSAGAQVEIKRSLLKHIRGADRRIWLATAYFIPSWKIRRALRHAARHGLDVRLLLPGPHTDHPSVRHAGHRFYGRLLRAGVRIFEYQPRFLHAKLVLCDEWASIGSSNLDRWNLRWNLEANQEMDDPTLAAALQAQFTHDFGQSRELDARQWARRAWYGRLLEWFWGRVDLWLERHTRQQRRRREKRQRR